MVEQAALHAADVLGARFAHAAFDRRHERRRLAADERATAADDGKIEFVVGSHDGLAQDAGCVCVVDGVLDVVACERVFVADVEHALFGADGERTDDHALDDGMRAALHRRAVHECAGVALVAVADDVFGEDIVAGGCAPFAPGGEAGAALAAQAGFLDFGDDLVGRHGKRLLQALVATACDVVVE